MCATGSWPDERKYYSLCSADDRPADLTFDQGAGIARTFARHGYAVALLARNRDRVSSLASAIRSENPYAGVGGPLIAQGFETDTSSSRLKSTFDAISQHPDFKGKPLKVAIWHVKHSSKAPFLDVTEESFDDMLQTYIKGAFAFSRLVIPLLLEGNKAAPASPPGTLIFTGTCTSWLPRVDAAC